VSVGRPKDAKTGILFGRSWKCEGDGDFSMFWLRDQSLKRVEVLFVFVRWCWCMVSTKFFVELIVDVVGDAVETR